MSATEALSHPWFTSQEEPIFLPAKYEVPRVEQEGSADGRYRTGDTLHGQGWDALLSGLVTKEEERLQEMMAPRDEWD